MGEAADDYFDDILMSFESDDEDAKQKDMDKILELRLPKNSKAR
eukprot:CAMPEP_0206238866 /NCGR_PEP_ID=MMETSP0047_2-20121206/15054_1 /ASSEMBLY_ACC=CAM_ASM_000192 /TAXON_ID=195065 /ORGANISM="Chroomonas mesostigmatica_cf, Strain CCMP1168" /LENGTH=43 /DNA_ID= /DNA_START= /DNA_END= /DNA_ORIENTATION=